MKAYTVTEGDEGHGCVVFAKNGAEARRVGAAKLDTDWSGIDSCRRSPDLDEYAPGPVPPLVLIEHGWWFECSHCGIRVSQDMHDDEALDAEGFPVERAPVASGQAVYCCAAHRMADWVERRHRKAVEAAICEATYTKHPPGILVHHVGNKAGGRPYASFTFPGGTYSVEWDVGADHVMVLPVDVEAWKKFSPPPTEPAVPACN